MAATSLADLLPDFARERSASGPEDGPLPCFEMAEAADQVARDPVSDETAIAARIGEAEAALRETLQAEHQAELEAERARHADEIEALQAKLGGEAGAAIEARFADAEARVSELAASVTARILSVTLTEDLQRRAVDELARVVTAALRDREAVQVRVRGASRLFEALQSAMGDKAEHLQFSEAAGFDLTVSIDESLFETRLSEWSEALSEVLA